VILTAILAICQVITAALAAVSFHDRQFFLGFMFLAASFAFWRLVGGG
jgi:hypothetical protein